MTEDIISGRKIVDNWPAVWSLGNGGIPALPAGEQATIKRRSRYRVVPEYREHGEMLRCSMCFTFACGRSLKLVMFGEGSLRAEGAGLGEGINPEV